MRQTMASTSFNDLLATADDAGFELFPVGTYDCVVEAAEAEQHNGRDQVTLQLKVLSGPLAGRKFRHRMKVISEYPGLVAQWFAEMNRLGLDRAYFQSEPGYAKVAADTIGRQVRVQVGRRQDKRDASKEFEDIKVIAPLGGGAPGVPQVPGVPSVPSVPQAPAVPAPAHAADASAPNLPPF